MSEHLDRALEAIDGGLQRSEEEGFGSDFFPDRCWRCQRNPIETDAELCAGCRAYLLGDGPDPLRPVPAGALRDYVDGRLREDLDRHLFEGDGTGTLEGITAAVPTLSSEDLEEFVDFARRVFEAFADAARRIAEAFASIDWNALRDDLERIAERARETSRRATPNRPTLSRGAQAPPRDLRATEATRRPPTFRRKTP